MKSLINVLEAHLVERFYKTVSGLDMSGLTDSNKKECKRVIEKLFGKSPMETYIVLTNFSPRSFEMVLRQLPNRFGFKYTYDGGMKMDFQMSVIYYMKTPNYTS